MDYFSLSRKTNAGIFLIQGSMFGILNGEVLSIMQCKEMYLEVIDGISDCTEEIQVKFHDETISYVVPGSRIIQETFTKQKCNDFGVGNVVEVHRGDKTGPKLHIIQQSQIRIYDHVTGKVQDNEDLFYSPVYFDYILNYQDFHGSGLYSSEFMEERRKWIFR